MQSTDFTEISDINPAQFQRELLQWYKNSGRHHLPWRQTNNAYHILVSEIMLQQTQVDTVLNRYYHPFLKQFPDLLTLKNAPLETVLHAWQGLGYYRRAGYLHQIAKRTAPCLPTCFDELIALPGIGKNTAHAVLSFAHHQAFPVMEANVKRILSRIFALTNPSEKMLWSGAEKLLNRTNPFDHNQAMMDMGAMICTVKNPLCTTCPAQSICRGKSTPMEYPAKQAKREVPTRNFNIVIATDRHGRIFATPRSGRFLSGLYQFIELAPHIDTLKLNSSTFCKTHWQKLGHITQQYSHFTLLADVFRIDYQGEHQSVHWHDSSDLNSLPWSNAEKKILQLL